MSKTGTVQVPEQHVDPDEHVSPRATHCAATDDVLAGALLDTTAEEEVEDVMIMLDDDVTSAEVVEAGDEDETEDVVKTEDAELELGVAEDTELELGVTDTVQLTRVDEDDREEDDTADDLDEDENLEEDDALEDDGVVLELATREEDTGLHLPNAD